MGTLTWIPVDIILKLSEKYSKFWFSAEMDHIWQKNSNNKKITIFSQTIFLTNGPFCRNRDTHCKSIARVFKTIREVSYVWFSADMDHTLLINRKKRFYWHAHRRTNMHPNNQSDDPLSQYILNIFDILSIL